MRVITRLHACFAAAIVFILYFSYTRASSHIQERIQQVWTPSKGKLVSGTHKLVVFGDDWSDSGEYRVAPPPKSTIPIRDPDRGAIWTETLCKELACDELDDFARSIPANVHIATIGSVVDSDVFANVTAGLRNETLALFDFKTQVQHFIEFKKTEKPRTRTEEVAEDDTWTIFTVMFGLWDLWEYSMLDKPEAVHAIDRSVEELFYNLDLLADHAGGPIRAVIPKIIDLTFLPRFQMRKNNSDDIFAQDQHQLVFLWTYWNTVLSQRAAEWKGGDIYMPDLNGIVMDQVRAQQLYSKQISDAAGVGKQLPLFDEVEQPCLSSLKTGGRNAVLQAADVEKCFDPAKHLFWDSIHLSGPAHQLIGAAAAKLVKGNVTVGHRQHPVQGSTLGKKEDAVFNLKFPPGY